MPALQSDVLALLDRVKDGLAFNDTGTRASLITSAGGSKLIIRSRQPGASGNDYTVTFTLPGGNSPLAVSAVGTDVTVALAVTLGVATAGANTLALIAAATNSSIPGLQAYLEGPSTVEITAAIATASLAGGDGPTSSFGHAQPGGGYLRAQDLASSFELLQNATASGTLTATGGSTTTAVVTSITPGSYTGATLTFTAGTTTVALRGLSYTVASNNATTFTTTETMAGACAATDTFTVTSTFLNRAVSELRDAAGSAGSPAGDPYGRYLTFIDGCEFTLNQIDGSSVPKSTLSHASLAVAESPAATTTNIPLTATMRPGQYDGLLATIGISDPIQIDYNTESAIYLKTPLLGVPPAATAVAIQTSALPVGRSKSLSGLVHPGGHPDTANVIFILDLVQRAVEAFVLPS